MKKMYLETRRVTVDGCFVCKNKPNQDGYVRVGIDGRSIMLHVYEWEALNGKKPEGKELNHKCGNRGCCNPSHLELLDGSYHASLTNINRVGYTMERKTDDQIKYAYEEVKYKGRYINSLCRELDIKRSTLSSIINKRSRCKITDEVDNKYTNPLHTNPLCAKLAQL